MLCHIDGPVYCPAIIISGPASNQGKTTVTAALAYYHRRQGRNVKVFKVGPDFLDPTILEVASANPVYQLDLWMVGMRNCQKLLYEAAQTADLILIEGVMGLFDGSSSTADLAKAFALPVIAVIKAESMAQTFHAVAHGLATYDPDVKVVGVFANAVGSDRHAAILANHSLKHISYLGSLERSSELNLPSRYLGLAAAGEMEDLESRLSLGSDKIKNMALCKLPAPVRFAPVQDLPKLEPALQGCRIAIAKDAAFSFLYRRNVELLIELGADIEYFSPLKDDEVPSSDAIYLPGGYPELYLKILAKNQKTQRSIRNALSNGSSIYAECGGMLYLLNSLTDWDGTKACMLALLPGQATVKKKLARVAYQQIELTNEKINGHTFHYSETEIDLPPYVRAANPFNGEPGEPVYRSKNIWASYTHLYFDSNPGFAASLFGKVGIESVRQGSHGSL